ncbi:MAG TPA: hypothetical protein PKH77_27835 [Anaerolineae bacterium]|nr:hypothetical protein [Anaerolineae bacterium]
MSTVLKRCSRCEKEFPATSQHFYRDRTRPDGFESCCKKCKAEARGTEYREPPPPTPEGHKWCRTCKEIKPENEFYKKKRDKSGRASTCIECRSKKEGFRYKKPARDGYKRCITCQNEFPATPEYFYQDKRYGTFASGCKECRNAESVKWAKEYPEQRRAIQQRWADNNREKVRISGLKSYYAHKERYKEYYRANYQKHLDRGRKWYRDNIGRARELARRKSQRWRDRNPSGARAVLQRRLARKRSLPDTLTAVQWEHAIAYFGGCAYCGRPAGLFHTLAVEHVIPLSDPACPGTTALNCVPACHGQDGCNNQKGTKKLDGFLESKFGKRKAAQILKRIEAYFEWVRQQDSHS